MGLKTGGPVSMHTSHCTHIKSHHSSKKSRPLWPVMMNDSAPIHKRRKLVKPTKMCSLENGLWLLRYAGRPSPKMIKRWSRKTATKVKWLTPQIKGERWERERDTYLSSANNFEPIGMKHGMDMGQVMLCCLLLAENLPAEEEHFSFIFFVSKFPKILDFEVE